MQEFVDAILMHIEEKDRAPEINWNLDKHRTRLDHYFLRIEVNSNATDV
jgi:hypothetical protein